MLLYATSGGGGGGGAIHCVIHHECNSSAGRRDTRLHVDPPQPARCRPTHTHIHTYTHTHTHTHTHARPPPPSPLKSLNPKINMHPMSARYPTVVCVCWGRVSSWCKNIPYAGVCVLETCELLVQEEEQIGQPVAVGHVLHRVLLGL